jgi:hypothetical protein
MKVFTTEATEVAETNPKGMQLHVASMLKLAEPPGSLAASLAALPSVSQIPFTSFSVCAVVNPIEF